MIKFIAIATLLVVVATAGALPRRLDGKIVGGEEVPIEEVPHQISIQFNDKHHCGGSIISEEWVLTAAHCLSSTPDGYKIHAGSAHSQKPGSVHQISKIVSHTGFGAAENALNDIALIRVVEPFKFDETRKPVPLYAQDEEIPAGSVASISGWGNLGNSEYPEILHLVRVPIIPKYQCAKLYNEVDSFLEGQICALYDKGGKDACDGDSGGPLTVDGRLAGVVSWGEGCALPTKPGVYTEVAYFRDWIKKHSGV